MAREVVIVPSHLDLKVRIGVNATWIHKVAFYKRTQPDTNWSYETTVEASSGPGENWVYKDITLNGTPGTSTYRKELAVELTFAKDGQWHQTTITGLTGSVNKKPIKITGRDSFPDGDVDVSVTISW